MEDLGHMAPLVSTLSPLAFGSAVTVGGVTSSATVAGISTFGSGAILINLNDGNVMGVNVHNFLAEMEEECSGGFGKGLLGALKCFFTRHHDEEQGNNKKKSGKVIGAKVEAKFEIGPDSKDDKHEEIN